MSVGLFHFPEEKTVGLSNPRENGGAKVGLGSGGMSLLRAA